MKSEHRMVLAIVLATAFFILWYTVLNPNKEVARQETAVQQQAPASVQASTAAPTSVSSEAPAPSPAQRAEDDPQTAIEVRTWKISNDLIEAEFTNDGGVATSWKMKKYNATIDKNSPLIDLSSSASEVIPAFALSFVDADIFFPKNPRYEMISADDSHVSFRWRSAEIEILKTIELVKGTYQADVSIEMKNLTSRPIRLKPKMAWGSRYLPMKSGGFLGLGRQQPVEAMSPVYFMNGKAHRESDIAKLGLMKKETGSLLWSALEGRYFIASIIPRIQGEELSSESGVIKSADGSGAVASLWTSAVLPEKIIPAGDIGKSLFSTYAGPKDLELLKRVGVEMDKAIDYGWFTIIAIPIVYLLQFFHEIINNYGIAIIMLTIFVKLLLHPINAKSLKSMKEMQRVQPQLKELQKKFKDDKQRLNQETMALFKAHKVNPMGGCLPMLAQFPIYIALYKVLWNSIELFRAPFFWFYKDLSAPDPYYIMPILLGLFMAAQQLLTPSASADPAQKKMMMIMPIMFCIFMLFLPVGLVLYILVNTVMSVTQQWLYNKGIRMRDLIRGKWQPAAS
ncbi:MAG TPA: membrane protein insertase YidC [bacterium]|nr:membrane protein insertase YidC [bacterium]